MDLGRKAFKSKRCAFVSYLKVAAEEKFALTVKVTTELAWHNLLLKILFIRPAL